MELQKLVNELRRAAASIEALILDPANPRIQPGDIAQIRLDGHADHPGRLVIVNRTTQKGFRATLLDMHRNGSWGTDLTLMPAQLQYVGTPHLTDAPARLDSNMDSRRASLAPATSAPAGLTTPGEAMLLPPPTPGRMRQSRRKV